MNKIITIPNLLSMLRIVLALVILQISVVYGVEEKRMTLVMILVLSGITDFLDGKIARRFNMISELGKILDPIADKLTQVILLLCFIQMYDSAKYVLFLLIVKEIILAILGLKNLVETKINEGAQWHGKVCTAFFYGVMFLLLFVPGIPEAIAEGLIIFSGILMFVSLVLYGKYYKNLKSQS